ncbi:hypothetical protein [Citrobacter sp. Cu233]|uniref:hypothetical protein n=1 Tax=Citrobacter sp. Cu233 TaxID=2985160 RepID=UPI00257506CA|nr:hypothetical protein [Citrobacter sp. Cu233]MDM2932064.1 hypothetical protein [Citrobacter sp. Cu233]
MPYKRMENLYSTYCDSIVLKVIRSEREIERLENLIIANTQKKTEIDYDIITLWSAIAEKKLTKNTIYNTKRKESLLLSALYRLETEKNDLVQSKLQQENEKSRLKLLRARYERKKRKWSLCRQKVKSQRNIKLIAREESLTEECASWKM